MIMDGTGGCNPPSASAQALASAQTQRGPTLGSPATAATPRTSPPARWGHPPAPLTKRAPLGGDSETRTLKGPGEATWASRRAVLARLREPPSRSMGHFQQVHAAAPLTSRTKSSSSDYLAPQMWLSSRSLSGERFPTAVRVATQWKWLPISRLITRKYRKSDVIRTRNPESVRRALSAKVFVFRRLDCVRTPCHLCRWLF